MATKKRLRIASYNINGINSRLHVLIRWLEEFKPDTQFLVITHNPRTMQSADAVYGVTMQEPGVSTIVGVRLGEPEHAKP